MDLLDDLRAKIETFGWAVRNVTDADPAQCVSYTVGLTSPTGPEIAHYDPAAGVPSTQRNSA